jgi:hypothetical protein
MLTEEEWVDEWAFFSPSTTAQIIITRSTKFDFLINILSEALNHRARLHTL